MLDFCVAVFVFNHEYSYEWSTTRKCRLLCNAILRLWKLGWLIAFNNISGKAEHTVIKT